MGGFDEGGLADWVFSGELLCFGVGGIYLL